MRRKRLGFASELEMQEQWSRLYDSHGFHTECNYPLTIRSVGTWNHESGPDFMNAAIKIGNSELKGDIELHLLASDWFTHGHHQDPSYGNVFCTWFVLTILNSISENSYRQCWFLNLQKRLDLEFQKADALKFWKIWSSKRLVSFS